MADDKIFADGFIYKPPREGAPDYVKGSLSIKVADFMAFLQQHEKPDGWVNLDIKESKGGKLYAELNTWTRDSRRDDQTATGDRREPAPTAPARRAPTARPPIAYPQDDINPDDIPF